MSEKFDIDVISLFRDTDRTDLRANIAGWLSEQFDDKNASVKPIEWIIENENIEYSLRTRDGPDDVIIVAHLTIADGVLFRLLFTDFKTTL